MSATDKRLLARPRLQPKPLPNISQEARDAFACGWLNGIAVGAISAAAVAVIVWKVVA